MTSAFSSWLSHPALLWGLGCFSVLAVLASVLLVPRYLASLPPDYLHGKSRDSASLPFKIVRNAFGIVLVLLGIAMLLLPGQGLITLLVGLLLIDFPGKQKVIRRLLGRPKILNLVNKLRARHQVPPLDP